jgi:hypothetical protein
VEGIMPKIYFEKMHPLCEFAKPPEPANKVKPQWWYDSRYYAPEFASEKYGDKSRYNSTIKNCPAIADAISFGYILFTPIDIEIDATNEDEIKYRFKNSVEQYDSIFEQGHAIRDIIGSHYKEQVEQYAVPDEYHKIPFKINTLFGIKTDPGYSCWITHPMHNLDLPYFVLSGIVDTDKVTSRYPYPLFIRKGFKGVISAGTPLIQVIPFKREDYEAEIIDFDQEDVKRVQQILSSDQITPYRKNFWSRKRFV